jgi:hypothetical protein
MRPCGTETESVIGPYRRKRKGAVMRQSAAARSCGSHGASTTQRRRTVRRNSRRKVGRHEGEGFCHLPYLASVSLGLVMSQKIVNYSGRRLMGSGLNSSYGQYGVRNAWG